MIIELLGFNRDYLDDSTLKKVRVVLNMLRRCPGDGVLIGIDDLSRNLLGRLGSARPLHPERIDRCIALVLEEGTEAMFGGKVGIPNLPGHDIRLMNTILLTQRMYATLAGWRAEVGLMLDNSQLCNWADAAVEFMVAGQTLKHVMGSDYEYRIDGEGESKLFDARYAISTAIQDALKNTSHSTLGISGDELLLPPSTGDIQRDYAQTLVVIDYDLGKSLITGTQVAMVSAMMPINPIMRIWTAKSSNQDALDRLNAVVGIAVQVMDKYARAGEEFDDFQRKLSVKGCYQ